MDPDPTKRLIRVFADDLFRYLFLKRINIEILTAPLREIDDPTPTFDPVIGLSILCICHPKQREYFKYFLQHLPDIVEHKSFRLDRLPSFCVVANDHFYAKSENKWEEILNLASIFLELAVFASAQGFKQIKYFSSVMWADTIQNKLALNSFNSDDLNELVCFASNSFDTYIKKNSEICTDQDNRTDIKTESLREYDSWALQLSSRRMVPLDSEPVRSAFVPNRIYPVKILQIDSLISYTMKVVMKSADPLTHVKFWKSYQKQNIAKLMNNEFYIQVISDMIKKFLLKGSSRLEVHSLDLLQIANFVLGDKETLAKFCYLALQCVNDCRGEDITNLLSSVLNETDEITVGKGRVVRDFRRTIDQNRDPASKEIVKYLKDKPNSRLLDKEIFRKLMHVVAQYPNDLWDKYWILSVMISLDKNFKSSVVIFPGNLEKTFWEVRKELLEEIEKRERTVKSPIEKNKTPVAHKPNVKEIDEKEMATKQTEDFSEIFPVLKNVYKKIETLITELEEKEASEAELSEESILDEKTTEPNLLENNSLYNKLTEEEHKSVRESCTPELHQTEQLSHDTANVNESCTDVSSSDLDDKYFDTIDSKVVCNEWENGDPLINTTSRIPLSRDYFALSSANVSRTMCDGRKIKATGSSENVIEPASIDTLDSISSNPKVVKVEDSETETKFSVENELQNLDLNERETEKRTESDITLHNPTTELRKKPSNSQSFSKCLRSDSDSYGESSTISLKTVMDEVKDSEILIGKNTDTSEMISSNSRLENLEDFMDNVETQNSDTNEEESEKQVRPSSAIDKA